MSNLQTNVFLSLGIITYSVVAVVEQRSWCTSGHFCVEEVVGVVLQLSPFVWQWPHRDRALEQSEYCDTSLWYHDDTMMSRDWEWEPEVLDIMGEAPGCCKVESNSLKFRIPWKKTLGCWELDSNSLKCWMSWWRHQQVEKLRITDWGVRYHVETLWCFIFFELLFPFFNNCIVLSHWDFSHGKFGLLSLGKASCGRVTLPNLRWILLF